MTSYRMYFRNGDGPGVATRGRDDFEAHDDVEATRIAAPVGEASGRCLSTLLNCYGKAGRLP